MVKGQRRCARTDTRRYRRNDPVRAKVLGGHYGNGRDHDFCDQREVVITRPHGKEIRVNGADVLELEPDALCFSMDDTPIPGFSPDLYDEDRDEDEASEPGLSIEEIETLVRSHFKEQAEVLEILEAETSPFPGYDDPALLDEPGLSIIKGNRLCLCRKGGAITSRRRLYCPPAE